MAHAEFATDLPTLIHDLGQVDEAGDPARVIAICQRILGILPGDLYPLQRAGINAMLGGALLRTAGDEPDRIGQAITSLEAAVTEFSPKGTPQPWAATHGLLAAAYCRADGDRVQNLESAIDHGLLGLHATDVPPGDLAGLLNNLGAAFLDRLAGAQAANSEAAISYLTRALEAFGSTTVSPRSDPYVRAEWARVQLNLGRAHGQLARSDPVGIRRALGCFEHALQVWTRDDYPGDFAAIHANMGDVLLSSSHEGRAVSIAAAIGHYETAWQVLRECPRSAWPPGWTWIVSRLGSAYASQLHKDRGAAAKQADDFLRQVLDYLDGMTPAGGPGRRAVDRAHVLSEFGACLANPALRHVPGYAERREHAIGCLIEAAEIFSPKASPGDWATAKNRLGVAYSDRVLEDRAANLGRAVGCYQEALTVQDADAFPADRAETLHNLGAAHADLAAVTSDTSAATGEARAAAGYYSQALDCFRRLHDHPKVRTTAWELAKCRADIQEWHLAADAYAQAVSAIDTLYAASLLHVAREAELADATGLHNEAAYALAKAGRYRDAAVMLERGHARILGESLARDTADLADLERSNGGLARSYREAADTVRRLEIRQRQVDSTNPALGGNPPSAAPQRGIPPADLAEMMRAATARLDAVISQIRAAGYPAFLARPGWPDIARATQPDRPLAYLTVTLRGGMMLLAHRTGTDEAEPATAHTEIVPLFTADGPELLRDLWELLITTGPSGQVTGGYLPSQRPGGRDGFDTALHAILNLLSTHLIQPLADQLTKLGTTSVTLVPGPPLSLLPLHAASSNGPHSDPLLATVDVSYAPSARVLAAARTQARNRPDQPPSLAGVANPDGTLRYPAAELREAASHFPGQHRVLEGDAANHDNLINAAAGATHLHLSCHGHFDPADPLQSALHLAAGTSLTLHNLLTNRPFSAARLVVMSACQTASSDIRRLPAEAIGLPSAVLLAGTPAVIGTLWLVDDLASALLMTRFYDYYLGNHMHSGQQMQPPPVALARAQHWLSQATPRDLLDHCQSHPALYKALQLSAHDLWLDALPRSAQPFQDPYYWAAYVHVGTS